MRLANTAASLRAKLPYQLVWQGCMSSRELNGPVVRGRSTDSSLSDRAAADRKSEAETAGIVKNAFEHAKAMMLDQPFALPKLREPHSPVEPRFEMGQAAVLQSLEVEEVVDSAASDSSVSSEWYHLHLACDGKFLVQILSHAGIHRAMATLLQLFQGHSIEKSRLYCGYCPVTIQDEPAFQHRGLNLDISRNIIYPADVQRTLEGMWLNKMNKLHLHATDSQSWPLEIASMPDLASKGAYDARQIWKVTDVEAIQKFGKDRGIEVYFEIDLPGHTASVHHAFPELIVGYKQAPWNQFAKEPPAGQLKLKSDGVRDFISRLLEDLLPRVAKHSRFFHIGGDEINRKIYTLEEGLESDKTDALEPLLQKFYDLCLSKLSEHGLTPILWEEVFTRWDLKFPEATIFQSWKSQESLSRIVKGGHRALFGPCQSWYLDTGMGQWLEPDPKNPDTPVKRPFLSWCEPYKNWRTVYTYSPFQGVEEAHRHLIFGGEVHLWTEMVDSVCLDFMLWPRVAAAAEVLWSGPGPLDEGVTRRLAEMRERLVALGIRSGMVQMEWSLRNPGCSYL